MNSTAHIHRLVHLLRQNRTHKNLLQIHAQLITTGLQTNPSCLASLFSHCLSNPFTLCHALAISCHASQPSALTQWLTRAFRRASETNPSFAVSLLRSKFSIRYGKSSFDDPFLYASLIKACNKLSAFREGKSIHCYVLRLGLDYNVNVMNALIHFYSSFGNSVSYACVVFDEIPEKTMVTVNCMISGFVKNKLFNAGLGLFNWVLGCSLDWNMKPNHVTLVILISGCAECGDFVVGNSIHSYCQKMGLGLSIEVSNALIGLYEKFGYVGKAVRVFWEMHQKDLISWNTLIAGYAKSNDCAKAFLLFREMGILNIECDEVTLISLILASANSVDSDAGKAVHGYIIKNGKEITVPIETALIKMYSKCGFVESARNVFDELPAENVASWNAMIFGYVECRDFNEALRLFDIIHSKKLKPDETTFVGLILACRNSGQLQHGIHIHSYIENSDHHGSIVLHNALIDMYVKLGSLNRANSVFNKMPERDVISWTSIIVGHAINGEGEKALVAFKQMRAEKIYPNSITFIGVLLACDHAGLVDDGRTLFDIMCHVYHIKPTIEHYGCMVDMHARAGMFEEAFKFIKEMCVEPNAVVWRMLMNACRVHGSFDVGLSLVRGLLDQDKLQAPDDHVSSSNVFAGAEKWNDVFQTRGLMVAQKAQKLAGKSSISDLAEKLA